MKLSTKILLILGVAVICGLIFAASSRGADWSGHWVIKNDPNYYGNLEVKKNGETYIVNLDVQEFNSTGSAGFCIMEQKGLEVNGDLEVYDENNVAFIVKQKGESIEVIPQLSPHRQIAWCGKYSLEIFNDDPAEKKIQMTELTQLIQNLKWTKCNENQN